MVKDVEFKFSLSAADAENFMGLFDSQIAKCNEQIADDLLAASLDPGYISRRDMYERDRTYFVVMRNKISSSRFK